MRLTGTNLKLGQRGDDVRALQTELDLLGIAVPDAERQQGHFGPGTQEAVTRFQTTRGLAASGIVDAATVAAIEALAAESIYVVSGTVSSPDRAGVGGLRVRLIDRNVAEDVELGTATTGARGHYELRFGQHALSRRRKAHPDLQAEVYADKTLIGKSHVRYNASRDEALHVRLPARVAALPAEHQTLTADLAAHYDGRLGALRETRAHPDISYLANKTGWDARAVAMAALADQLARTAVPAGTHDTAPGAIPAPFYYALLRAGLPADPAALYRTSAHSVRSVWQRAIEQAVIPRALAAQIPQALASFHRLAAANALGAPVAGRVSPLRDMLNLTLGNDDARQRQFAEIYTRHRNDVPAFWSAVGEAFGAETTRRLQLDGQLGQITSDNAPLLKRLYQAEQSAPLAAAIELAHRGYHRADKWRGLLDEAGPVPSYIPGASAAEKNARYAELLAAQVRLRFPTAVVAARVRGGELAITGDAAVREGVAAFLAQHQGAFVIGLHPLDHYLRKNGILEGTDPLVRQQVKRLQRVYQVTPSDQAMTVLLERDLDSAYKISRYSESEFIRTFAQSLGGEQTAWTVLMRSRQVHNNVVQLVTAHVANRQGQSLGFRRDNPIIDLLPKGGGDNADDVLASATLEELFGPLDFCACDSCASILSPAAYLVDLLQTLDRAGTNGLSNPQQVLLARRPDLELLPLTCENTNTALPYIDVVNETLEYFVANDLTLTGFEGHDTGDTVTSAELVAAPQNVDTEAYSRLEAALFPPPLPFHRDLEGLRRTFGLLEVPLAQAMETLRPDDAVERPSDDSYGWRDILMERLGLSRAEHALLTDGSLTLNQIYGYEAAEDALGMLSSAKTFARRLDLEYEDVVALLETKFINPDSILIPRLERLGASFEVLQAIKDGSISPADDLTFSQNVAGLDPTEYGGEVGDDPVEVIKTWIRDDATYARITGLIVLVDPTGSEDLCTFDNLAFRYSSPTAPPTVRAIELVKLLRFVRLWKKLGWTMEQTDQALAALLPPPATPPPADEAAQLAELDAAFRTFLPRLGLVVQLVARLKLRLKKDLPGLLALFGPIGTHGDASLYRTMFLNPAALALDDAFDDDGYGNVPKRETEALLAHREALRAAFNITDEELTLIVDALGYQPETSATPTLLVPAPSENRNRLDNLSAIYRRAWLARKLRLSVSELLLLSRLSGLDPFAPPDPPNPPIIRLLDLVQALGRASIKPVQALYLVWNEDVSGVSAPTESEITAFARVLRADFAQTEIDFALTDDPSGEIARSRMALVFGSDTTDLYFGLLADTLATSVTYNHGAPALEPAIVTAGAGRLSYDDFRKKLSYTGILTEGARDALLGATGASQAFLAAVPLLFQAGQDVLDPFFDRYPDLRGPYDTFITSVAPAEQKWTTLLGEFLPALKERRKRQQAVSDVSAASATDSALAQALLDDATVLHAAGSVAPALDDLLAMEAPGVIAAGGLSGHLETPESDSWNLTIETDPAATVTLRIDGANVPLEQHGGVWSNIPELPLTAGTLYPFELVVLNATAPATVSWATGSHGWEPIPGRYLYAAEPMTHLREAYVRLLKTAALVNALEITVAETVHLAAHPDYLLDNAGWLNALPVSGSPSDATAGALRDRLLALLDFARLKAAYAPADERLLAVLQDPAATLETGESLLFTLTGWDEASTDALLARFGNKTRPDLAHVDVFARVHDALVMVKKAGVTAEALVAAATNEPQSETVVAELQAAVRARYDDEDWLDAVKPVNDQVRSLRRDALVAHILRRLAASTATEHIDTPDKLFEYFLMDVQMDPCMLTSRVRHALSSVQLFVERCLLGLETEVSPESIDAEQWKWMKRYRVWEANRKIFLWPENWLEPELRDDQSPIFKEVMNELLESDITEDTAATAMLHYLEKLAEVAKLRPTGIHCDEENDDHGEIVHVVARTSGSDRKYYYRRREVTWSPWEQIKLDIEDTPVKPVVWNDRLFLFWVRILKTSPADAKKQTKPFQDRTSKLGNMEVKNLGEAASDQAATVKQSVHAVLCYSENVNGKWQPTRTSDVSEPLSLGDFNPLGENAFDRSKLGLSFEVEPDGVDPEARDPALKINLLHQVAEESWFVLYNTHSDPVPNGLFETASTMILSRSVSAAGDDLLTVGYTDATHLTGGPLYSEHLILRNLKHGDDDVTTKPLHPLGKAWVAPFFYHDPHHVFYVTTAQGQAPDDGYGATQPGKADTKIPDVVLIDDNPIDDPGGPVMIEGNPGVIDDEGMARFVSEDANIRTGLGTTGGVPYGDAIVGPNGALNKRTTITQ